MSRGTQVPARQMSRLRLRGSHALRPRFPAGSAVGPLAPSPVLQPRVARRHVPGLGSSAFARHYLRNHCYFLLLRVLRCFSSPRSLLHRQVTGSLPPGSPIRTSAHQRVFAPKRGFSQLVTSFFASESHRHPPCALIRFPFFLSPCIYDLVARLSLSPIPSIGVRRGTRLLDCSCSTSTPPRFTAAAWGLRFALPSCQ